MRKLILVFILLLASMPCAAHASAITLSSSQEVYMYGDTIVVVANLTNPSDEAVRVYVEHTLRDLMGRVATAYLLKVVDLEAHGSKLVELYDLKVDDGFYSGQYVVRASLIVNKVRIGEGELRFTVEGAPEDMDLRLLISPDPDHAGISHVYIVGEKVYMQLSVAPQGTSVSAKLKMPDNSTQQITLPLALTVKQVGEYTVYVNASAAGFRDVTIRDFFAALERAPDALADRKEDSSVSLVVEKTSYMVGDEVAVSGSISPPHADASVTLTYLLGGTVEDTVTVVTDDDGEYRDTYEPAKEGEWGVEASWSGDSNHNGADSQRLSFSVEAKPMNWLPIAIAAVVVLAAVALFISRRR